MTERELIVSRVAPVAARLKELGVTVPDMPEGEGNEFIKCSTCNGMETVEVVKEDGKEEEHQIRNCLECAGSGFLVSNALWEWQKTIISLWQKHLRGNGGS